MTSENGRHALGGLSREMNEWRPAATLINSLQHSWRLCRIRSRRGWWSNAGRYKLLQQPHTCVLPVRVTHVKHVSDDVAEMVDACSSWYLRFTL